MSDWQATESEMGRTIPSAAVIYVAWIRLYLNNDFSNPFVIPDRLSTVWLCAPLIAIWSIFTDILLSENIWSYIAVLNTYIPYALDYLVLSYIDTIAVYLVFATVVLRRLIFDFGSA
jgi:hypothetical protein